MTRDPFAGLGTTKPSIGAAYVKPGQHTFEIVKLKYVNERNEAFIAELKTAESDTHDVGATISWVVSLKYDGALPDIKGFAMAVLGVAEAQASEVDADVLHNMINTDLVIGSFVRCEAFNKITKKGNDFTKCRWSHVPPDEQEKLRAA